MWEALDPDERRFLLELPVTQRFTAGGRNFLLVHATPRDPLDEYLLRDPKTWAKRLQNVEADVVCVGHTHQPYVLEVGDKLVINPGSVGQPRDGDPRGAWLLLDTDAWTANFRRTEYDIAGAAAAIRAAHLPDSLAERLGYGQ
jgi:putative phosphoesterase